MASVPPTNLLIFVGLYQEDIVGFRVVADEQLPGKFRLQQLFLDRAHHGAIRAMRIRGPVLATGGADGRVAVAHLEEGTRWYQTMPNAETFNDVVFSACGRYLYVGGAERSIFVVDTPQRALVCRWSNVHDRSVDIVRVCPSTGRIFSLGQDRSLRLRDVALGSTETTDRFMEDGRFIGPITCLEFSPSGDHYVAAGENLVRVISNTGASIRAFYLINQAPIAVFWLDEALIGIGVKSGWCGYFRFNTGPLPHWQRMTTSGKLIAMAKVGKYLVTATDDTRVTLWARIDGSGFAPLCHADVAGKATTLAMVDTSELKLHPGFSALRNSSTEVDSDSDSSVLFVDEERLQNTNDSEKQISPTGQRNNTASSDDSSVIFIGEERLELETDDVDEEEQDLMGDQQEEVPRDPTQNPDQSRGAEPDDAAIELRSSRIQRQLMSHFPVVAKEPLTSDSDMDPIEWSSDKEQA